MTKWPVSSLDMEGFLDGNGIGRTGGEDVVVVGSRVRITRGRHFREFGAGDTGAVVCIDGPARMCEVAFDGRPVPLPVAMRHLEPELGRGASPSIAYPRSPGAGQWSGQQAESGIGFESLSQQCAQTLSHTQQHLSATGISPTSAAARAEDRAYEQLLQVQQERVRQEALELRRMAATTDVINGTASPNMGGQAYHDAYITHLPVEDEEALAAAVQASATATAAARVTGMMEVASLRSSINELRELVVHEAKQRVAGFQEIGMDFRRIHREVELLRADVAPFEGLSGRHVEMTRVMEGLRGKHGELHTLYMSISESSSKQAEQALDSASDLLEQRLGPLHSKFESLAALQDQHRNDLLSAGERHSVLELKLGEQHSGLEDRLRTLAESHRGDLLQELAAVMQKSEAHSGELHSALSERDERLRQFMDSHSAHGNRLEQVDERLRQFGDLHGAHGSRLEHLDERLKQFTDLHGAHGNRLETLVGRFEELGDGPDRIGRLEKAHGTHRDTLSQWEQKLAAFDQQLSGMSRWEQHIHSLNGRIDGIMQRGQPDSDQTERDSHHRRLDSLSARLDTELRKCTSELSSKPNRDQVLGLGHHEALTTRLDSLHRHLQDEVARLEGSHEGRVAELAKKHDRFRDSIDGHVSAMHEKDLTIQQLNNRVNLLTDALAAEARARGEALQLLEIQFKKFTEDQQQRRMSQVTSTDMEKQMKALLREVREDTDVSRREDCQRHQDSEFSLRRLCLEMDGLRDDVARRDRSPGPAMLPTTRQVVIQQPPVQLPPQVQDERIRQRSVNRSVMPAITNYKSMPMHALVGHQEQRVQETTMNMPATPVQVPQDSFTLVSPSERWATPPQVHFRTEGPREVPMVSEQRTTSPHFRFRTEGPREIPVVVETTMATSSAGRYMAQNEAQTASALGMTVSICRCGCAFAEDAFHCHKCGSARPNQVMFSPAF